MRRQIGAVCGLLLSMLSIGCVDRRLAIEEFAHKLADEVIIPAVKEGVTQGISGLTIQAGAQGINPTYEIAFEGKWVVGIEGKASVGVTGIAGQVQISTASQNSTGKDGEVAVTTTSGSSNQ